MLSTGGWDEQGATEAFRGTAKQSVVYTYRGDWDKNNEEIYLKGSEGVHYI